jgi:hypothetical protein
MVTENSLDKTIIYTTDNQMSPALMELCQRWLRKNSCGCPIISAALGSPVDFGDERLFVEGMPRSGITLDVQLLMAARKVKTKWVMLAEHDCLYTEEHVRWTPPDVENFFYNDNDWFLQWANPAHPEMDGMYSYTPHRKVQSQLVCSAEAYLRAMEEKVELVTNPAWARKYTSGRLAEPGCCDRDKTLLLLRPKSVRFMTDAIMHYVDTYKCIEFKTKLPNIDVRHSNNYTGPHRGKKRCHSLEPWGTMEEIIANASI